MSEFFNFLLNNIYFLIFFTLVVIFLLIRGKRIETKWISWESFDFNTNNKDHDKLILKDNLLRVFKEYKIEILNQRNNLNIEIKTAYEEMFIKFLEYKGLVDNQNYTTLESNLSLKIFLVIFDLIIHTMINQFMINAIFRFGFYHIDLKNTKTIEYVKDIDSFEKNIKDISSNLINIIDSNISYHRYIDDKVSYLEFVDFKKCMSSKEIQKIEEGVDKFIRILIEKRFFKISEVYDEFSKLFDNKRDCQRHCNEYFREIFEYPAYN